MNDENVLNHNQRDSFNGLGRRKSLLSSKTPSTNSLLGASVTTGKTDDDGRHDRVRKDTDDVVVVAAGTAHPSSSGGGGNGAGQQRAMNTPSRHRIRLPSAGQYYFKNMHSSKKHGDRDSSFISTGNSIGWGDTVEQDVFVAGSIAAAAGGREGDTGTFSQASMADTSFFSIAASSSSSDDSKDVLNKSTLSDTTELTASNFVLVATSKQALLQGGINQNKKKNDITKTNDNNVFHEQKEKTQEFTNQPKPGTESKTQPETISEEKIADGRSQKSVSSQSPDKNEQRENQESDCRKREIIGELQNDDANCKAHGSILRDASPSIRSRISSSPASLRQFSDGLRRARLQRQQLREEDAKRRQSLDGDQTIYSMNAELDMLTSDTLSSRRRLPPTFGLPKIATLPTANSNQHTSAAEESETSSFDNMEDLNDVLSIQNESDRLRRSSITAEQSSIQRVKGTMETGLDKETPGRSIHTRYNENDEQLSIPFSIAFREEFKSENSPEELLSERPDSARSTLSRSSERPSAVAQSPAKLANKFGWEVRKDSDGGGTTACNPSMSSALASLNTSTDKKDNTTYHSFNGDETASFGDINDTLSVKKSPSSHSEDSSFNRSLNDDSVNSGDDTASISDINAILGITVPFDTSTSDQSKIESDVEVSPNILRASVGSKAETASISDINAILGLGRTGETIISSIGASNANDAGPESSQIELRQSVGSKGDSASILDVDKIPGTPPTDDSNVSKSNGNIMIDDPEFTSNDSRGGLVDDEKRSKSLPSTPPKIDMSLMSPAGRNLLSQKKSSSLMSTGISNKDRTELRGTLDLSEKPMALTPNSRVAPTPTKLIQKPRLCVNPNNPESPARNTRRSGRNHSSEDTLRSEDVDSPATILSGSSRKNSMEAFRTDSLARNILDSEHMEPVNTLESESNTSFASRTADSKRRETLKTLGNEVLESPARNLGSSKRKHSVDALESGVINSPARNTRSSKRMQSIEKLENVASVSYAPGTSRRKSSIFVLNQSALTMPSSEREISFHQMSTPTARFSQQRSVAFGSPEAAVYNIGSPSASFTPMPKSEAKTLFPLPDKSSDDDVDGTSFTDSNLQDISNIEDVTMQIESNLDALVDKITDGTMNGSPELSPIEKIAGDTGVFNFSDQMKNGVYTYKEQSQFSPSSRSPSLSQTDHTKEDQTVALEAGMQSLIDNNLKNLSDGNGFHAADTSTVESVEKTDADSILSIHSRSETFTAHFDVSVEAETLDLSLDAPNGALSLGMDMTGESIQNEGHTIDLEGNMTTLLAAAATFHSYPKEVGSEADPTKDASPFDSGDDSMMIESPLNETETNKRRRKSIASASFSLDRTDDGRRFSLRSEGLRFGQEKSVSFSDTAEFIQSVAHYSSEENQVISTQAVESPIMLTKQESERLLASIWEQLRRPDQLDNVAPDVLEVFSSADQGMDAIVFEKWGQLLQAACREIESTTNAEEEAELTLSEHIMNSPHDELLDLLRKLESSGTDSAVVQKSLQELVKNTRRKVEREWSSWISQVLESFRNPLLAVTSNFDGESTYIEYALKSCDEYHQMISRMSHENARQVRRKSLLRRKADSTSLEDEIARIVNELGEIEEEIENLGKYAESAEEEKSKLNENLDIAGRYDEMCSSARACQKDYLCLRGLHSWNISGLCDAGMEFTTLGSCPQTCSRIYIQGMNTEAIQLRLEREDSDARSHKAMYRYKGAIAAFLDVCVGRMELSTSDVLLHSPFQVAEHLQTNAWLLGRLDLTAKELHVLQRRYGAKLVRKSHETFSLNVDFASSTVKVAVKFEVDPLYPSLPVDVSLDVVEGHVDLDVLQKTLTKNSRPGFGSLSKACDVLQSALSG